MLGGQPAEAARYFEDAAASVRQVIEARKDYVGGYVELPINECARDQPEAALAANHAALAHTSEAKAEFAGRAGEIPEPMQGTAPPPRRTIANRATRGTSFCEPLHRLDRHGFRHGSLAPTRT